MAKLHSRACPDCKRTVPASPTQGGFSLGRHGGCSTTFAPELQPAKAEPVTKAPEPVTASAKDDPRTQALALLEEAQLLIDKALRTLDA